MKFGKVFAFALAYSPFALAKPHVWRRQAAGDTCKIQLNQGSGGRKIAIVLDSSGSMSYNDPQDLRITAGKALNAQLVIGQNADLVTVVESVIVFISPSFAS